MHVTSFAPGPYTGSAHMCVPLYGMCDASSDPSYSTARSVVPRKVYSSGLRKWILAENRSLDLHRLLVMSGKPILRTISGLLINDRIVQ